MWNTRNKRTKLSAAEEQKAEGLVENEYDMEHTLECVGHNLQPQGVINSFYLKNKKKIKT